MSKPRQLINERVGSLTVIRDLGNDLFHCECDCGRYRTVSRTRLTSKDIESCRKCAIKNRKTAYLKRPADPPEPEPPKLAEVRTCTAFCIGRLIDGRWMIAHDPDCAVLGLFRINLRTARKAETRVYPPTM